MIFRVTSKSHDAPMDAVGDLIMETSDELEAVKLWKQLLDSSEINRLWYSVESFENGVPVFWRVTAECNGNGGSIPIHTPGEAFKFFIRRAGQMKKEIRKFKDCNIKVKYAWCDLWKYEGFDDARRRTRIAKVCFPR